MAIMPPFRNRKKAPAFTLVEVVMALGIVSFACLTMMALLPIGLLTFHQAQNNTAETQIIQNISSGMQLAKYVNVTNLASGTPYGGTNFYFDSEGIQLPNATASVYTASVISSKDLTNAVPFSGSANSSAAPLSSGMGTTVLIQIASPGATNLFPVIIANSHQ